MSLKSGLIFLLLAACIYPWPSGLVSNFHNLSVSPQTIFYQTPLELERTNINVGLYPTPMIGRLFQNKLLTYANHYWSNFFTLLDPNNYFFQSHPREQLPPNLNLSKFNFLAVIPFFYGLYRYLCSGRKSLIFIIFLLIAALSTLKSVEPFDFILYPFISYFIYLGLDNFFTHV